MAETETNIGDEEIRQRAYEISQGPDAGTDEENWHRALEELRRKAAESTDAENN